MLGKLGLKSHSLLGVGVCVFTFWACCTSQAQTQNRYLQPTLDGAVQLARQKLAESKTDATGRALLEFVLAQDDGYEEALLMVSELQDGLDVKPPAARIQDEGKTFAAFLARAASEYETSKIEKYQVLALLNYAVAKMIDPANREARLALVKAERAGVDIDFSALLKSFTGGKVVKGSSVKTPAFTSTTTPGTSAVGNLLETITLDGFSVNSNSPVSPINTLNGHVWNRGVKILIKASSIRIAQVSYSRGFPYYYAYSSYSDDGASPVYQHMSFAGEVTAGHVLRAICRAYRLSYSIVGDEIHVVDLGAPGASAVVSFNVTPEQLVEEFKGSISTTLEKYKDKPIYLSGRISTVKTAMGDYAIVELADGKVRVMVDRKDAKLMAKFEKMRSDFSQYQSQSLKEKQALARYSPNSSYYQSEKQRLDAKSFNITVSAKVEDFKGSHIAVGSVTTLDYHQSSGIGSSSSGSSTYRRY